MVTEFLEGEVYRNSKLEQDIMVYGVGSEDDEEVILAIGYIDRESEEMTAPGEITIKRVDFKDWEAVVDSE